MMQVLKAGVAGWPVDHSLSPLMMRAWLEETGVSGRYERYAAAPGALAECLEECAASGLAGLNITLPHKQEALRLASAASDGARAAGAANLLVFAPEGGVCADNTDIAGVRAALKEDDGCGPAVLIGAGGAARAALQVLAGQDRPLRLVNRTRARAEALLEDMGAEAACFDSPAPGALEGARLIINATALGMSGQPELEIDLGVCAPDALVFDMVYSPLETGLLAQARARGLRAVDGLTMLIGQARPAFEVFYGRPAPDHDGVRSLLEAALEARG